LERIARAAEVSRERVVSEARTEITERLKISKEIDLDTFNRASITGVTSRNIEAIQKEISELPRESQNDISSILKIVRKFEVVDKVATSDRIYPSMLQEVGLIPQGSEHRAVLTAALRKLPASERSTYLAIKQAIDAQMAEIQSRKTRLSQVIARIAARRKP
jgi:hypothetical protein